MKLSPLLLLASLCLAGSFESTAAEPKKIVLVAGSVSHGKGEHEFRAGCLLLKDCLDAVPGVTAVVVTNGWPVMHFTWQVVAATLGLALLMGVAAAGFPAWNAAKLKIVDGLRILN